LHQQRRLTHCCLLQASAVHLQCCQLAAAHQLLLLPLLQHLAPGLAVVRQLLAGMGWLM
jgi:hypothetical protein